MDKLVLRLDGRARAALVARTVGIIARRRVEAVRAEYGRDWSDRDAYETHVAFLQGIARDVHVGGTRTDPVVIIRPHWTPASGKGVAAGILDQAVTAVGDRYDEYPPCTISDLDDDGGAQATWERKPNLERYHDYLHSWHVKAPMVAVDFEGRTFYLNWDAQSMAVTVANRFAFRHAEGQRVHARYLLLLAKHLGVDTYTVSRLVMVVAYDHCGVAIERNQALRILSEHEENMVHAFGARVLPIGVRL